MKVQGSNANRAKPKTFAERKRKLPITSDVVAAENPVEKMLMQFRIWVRWIQNFGLVRSMCKYYRREVFDLLS